MSSEEVPVHGHCDPRFERVREIFTANLSSGNELGSAVAFVLDGEPVVDLWGGWLDFDHTREWERDTLVNVYSTTKGMTAICAHQLAERQQLDFDVPVAEYWPEFAAGGKAELKVRDLLCHRAGLPGVRQPLPHGALYDWELITRALAEEEPWWEPGSRHGYHAITYGHLVGELIRRISGRSVGQFFEENVAGPLSADFHIGLAAEHDPRTSKLHGKLMDREHMPPANELPEFLREFIRSMSDPSTMTGAAFGNPPQKPGDVNSRAWRAAEIPAANGHGTARALARIYGALARGGELDGVRILEPGTIDAAIVEHADGPDAVLGGLPMRFGLGFMLRSPIMPLSPSPRAFGHPGAGGSIGMADPDARVGFGYTLNKMQMGLVGGPGGFKMLRAFFKAL
ncbi:MAG: beta-lactamase family protein [Deltaproteobacteria bacterium]|nr:beta-lactamase family protein [Deltaproteobacteria bacterium]MBW2421562.1 beta-lactamase family protein [Deltaproteobacteria bacterium]